MNYQVYTNVGKIVQNLRNKLGPYNDKDTENTTYYGTHCGTNLLNSNTFVQF